MGPGIFHPLTRFPFPEEMEILNRKNAAIMKKKDKKKQDAEMFVNKFKLVHAEEAEENEEDGNEDLDELLAPMDFETAKKLSSHLMK